MNAVLVVVLVAVLLGQPGPAAVMYGFTDAGQFATSAGDDPTAGTDDGSVDGAVLTVPTTGPGYGDPAVDSERGGPADEPAPGGDPGESADGGDGSVADCDGVGGAASGDGSDGANHATDESDHAAQADAPDEMGKDEMGEVVDRLEDPSVPPGVVVFTSRREGSVDEDEEDDVLDSEPRATLYETVAGSPGISMTEVAEETGIPLSTARYHSRVLTNADVIDEEKIRGKRRLFPAAMGPDRRELAAAMADDATASLLAATYHLEPVGVCELAEELDRSASTVSYHLGRLEEAGLVERERAGDGTVTRLDPSARSALDPDGATIDADVSTLD